MLIVDDDEDLRGSIRDYAESLGIDVWEAPSGVEALWILEEHRPALVLLDLNMPRLGGFETLNHLRAKHASVRVVVVTGNPTDETRRRLASLGVELLVKPLAVSALDSVFTAQERTAR